MDCRPRRHLMGWPLCLHLQELRKRYRRISQSGGIDRDSPLDQPSHRADIALRVGAERVRDIGPGQFEADLACASALPPYLPVGLCRWRSDALDIKIELFRP